MKRIHWLCIAVIFLLPSCNKEDNKGDREIVLQKIGVRDCWGGEWDGDEVGLCDSCSLFFVVKSTGILKFAHRPGSINTNGYVSVESSLLKRQIIHTWCSGKIRECNAGLVDKGDTITISSEGAFVKISCIRIVAIDSSLEDDF